MYERLAIKCAFLSFFLRDTDEKETQSSYSVQTSWGGYSVDEVLLPKRLCPWKAPI